MHPRRKTEQLQIRVTAGEKAEIRSAAKAAKMDLSSWVLRELLANKRRSFREHVDQLSELGKSSLAFAALSDFLHELPPVEFARSLDISLPKDMSSETRNYLAAMVEHAAAKKNVRPPSWTKDVEPLSKPYFGTKLKSLRLFLMTHAPIAFRRRNIFIDSSVGDRV